MITVQKSGIICVWDLASGAKVRTIQINPINSICGDLSIDGRYLAIKEDNGKSIWDLEHGIKKETLDNCKLEELGFDFAYSINPVFLPDNTVVFCSEKNRIGIWDLEKASFIINIFTRGFDQYGFCNTCSIDDNHRYGIITRNRYLSLVDLNSGTIAEYASNGDLYLPETSKFTFTQNKNILISVGDEP